MSDEIGTPASSLVTVVDDEDAVRVSISELLWVLGYSVDTYGSAEAFLDSDSVARTRCLVLDFAMPTMTGSELLLELARRGHRIPVVFITAHDDARDSLLASGAVDCLLKPFGAATLEPAVKKALGL